jgi:hypothetical protein
MSSSFTPLLKALRGGASSSELDTLLATIEDPNALVPDHTVACESYWQTVAGGSDYGVRFTNCSLLHIAVYHRHVYMVQALLGRGANVKPAHPETPEILFFCETPESPKWRYFGCTPLHLAVSGEEAVSVAGDSDAANVKKHSRQITTLLCDHIGVLDNDAKRDIVEERCGDIEWFYRGGPFWQIRQATALQTAVFFSCNLETGRGADDAADLVRLLGADRSQVRCRHIIDDASDNADGFCELFLMTADDFAAAFGKQFAWMDLPGREHDRMDAFTETLLNDAASFSSCYLHHKTWQREGHPLFEVESESGGGY